MGVVGVLVWFDLITFLFWPHFSHILFYFFIPSYFYTRITSTPVIWFSRYFNLNTTINTLNCFCAFFQKLYQSAMTLYRTWIKRWDYFGNTPFLSHIHLTKSPQTLVKWAFQAYIYITSVQKTAIFKHFLRIFATHSVGLYHIILLKVMPYSHLSYGLISDYDFELVG